MKVNTATLTLLTLFSDHTLSNFEQNHLDGSEHYSTNSDYRNGKPYHRAQKLIITRAGEPHCNTNTDDTT